MAERRKQSTPNASGRATDRLKLTVDWESAAERLVKTPAKTTPPRQVKPRKQGKTKGP
jgi:hypothetical protein